MKETNIKSHIILYLVLMIFLLLLFNILISVLGAFVEYKLSTTSEIMINSAIGVLRHPIKYIGTSISNRNPLFIIGNIFIIIYTIAMCIKGIGKQNSWESDTNDTHGSAKWGDKNSLIASGDFRLVPYKKFSSEWEQTLK